MFKNLGKQSLRNTLMFELLLCSLNKLFWVLLMFKIVLIF